MKALLLEAPNRLTIQNIPEPTLEVGDILLRVNACGICVSDIHKIRYRTLAKPTVLGHEIAGVVARVAPGVTRFREGDRVVVAHHVPCLVCHFCQRGSFSMCEQFRQTQLDPGGFCEFVRVPATHVTSVAFPIPAGLSDHEACFMEPLGCCVRNVRRVGIKPGDTVVIVGLGSIGLFLGQLVQVNGGHVIGLDLDPARHALAKAHGFRAAFTAASPEFESQIKEITSGRGADVVMFTAGKPAMVSGALGWMRDGGTLNLFASFHPESQAPVDWNPFYYREISVVTSYSPSPVDLEEALRLLGEQKVKVSKLLAPSFTLERFDEALKALDARHIMKAIVTPHANG